MVQFLSKKIEATEPSIVLKMLNHIWNKRTEKTDGSIFHAGSIVAVLAIGLILMKTLLVNRQ